MTDRLFQGVWRYITNPMGKASDEFAAEINDEISFHIDQRARDLERQGFEPSEAESLAIAKFGDVSKIAAECHAVATSKINWIHRAHLLVTAGLALAVLALFLDHFRKSVRSFANLPPGISELLDNDWSGNVNGKVLSDDGSPIVGARLMISVKTWPDGSFFQRVFSAVTNHEGSFRIDNVRPRNEQCEVQVTAIALDREMRSSYRVFKEGETASIDFQLSKSTKVTLQLLDGDGNPMPHVLVLPHERVDVTGQHHLVYVDSGKPIIGTTDQNGQIELPYFQAGDAFTVLVQTQGEWLPFETTVPIDGEIASIQASKSL